MSRTKVFLVLAAALAIALVATVPTAWSHDEGRMISHDTLAVGHNDNNPNTHDVCAITVPIEEGDPSIIGELHFIDKDGDGQHGEGSERVACVGMQQTPQN